MTENVTKRKGLDPRHLVELIILCFIGIAVNLALSKLSGAYGLPFYLDAVGTVFAAAVGGTLPGIIVGLSTNILKSISDWPSIYYGTLNVMIAVATSMFTRDGVKRKSILPMIFTLAAIGGMLGSVLTWFLFGFAGEGVSADLAKWIHAHLFGSEFLSQITADFCIDVGDKAISVAIACLGLLAVPNTIMENLRIHGWRQKPLNFRELRIINRTRVRQISLRTKLILLLSAATTIIAIVSIAIGYYLFCETTINDHAEFAQGIMKYQTDCLDPEMIDTYLALGRGAPGYTYIESQLRSTFASSDNIRFMYVYQIKEDGCHVVFDMDTEDVKADEVGTVIPYPEDIAKNIDAFLAGEQVEPQVSNDPRFGWVLNNYEPVFDKNGRCVCYSCADISMNQMQDMTSTYLAKQIALFLGVFIMVLCLGEWLADYHIIYPLNSMAYGASSFAYTSTNKRNSSVEKIKSLEIRTGDEIENLYCAYAQTTEESMRFMNDSRKKAKQIDKMQSGLLMVLADLIESRDKCTGDHIRKTAAYTKIILDQLKKQGGFPEMLTDEYIGNVVRAAPLHDIGKINVPDAILNDPGPGRLTDEQFEIMKSHAQAGYEIITKAIANMEDSGYLEEARQMAHYHHEKWDGSGYPEHLKGEEIPLSARIMAVADVFDALMSKRSYKPPFTFEKAMQIITEGSGKHFDPKIVSAFVAAEGKVLEVLEEFDGGNLSKAVECQKSGTIEAPKEERKDTSEEETSETSPEDKDEPGKVKE
ncbi:MAG: HD domain-containing protein [Clostridiales bacterium]|nr:HD domain-containing protein [Clostridiales bacterium]